MRLNEIYKMTAFIYQDANLSRSKEATFLHFVEVCGMLTMVNRKKKSLKIDIPAALCKALGWYFPLMSKMGVESIEDLIYSKYPNVCPYCRTKPHVDSTCKLVKGQEATVSHGDLEKIVELNKKIMPIGLNEWQKMFKEIYPRNYDAGSFSIVALFEELGELAEAIRVFDRFPHYFYGEAADVFSYLMGLANEYEMTVPEDAEPFNFEVEYLSRYPGLCINCGARSCMCPPVPQATIGRMAKEMKIDTNQFQISNREKFSEEGDEIAKSVFEKIGSDHSISRHLPFDRGELNSLLTLLCMRLANATQSGHPAVAEKLRAQALMLGSERAERGTTAVNGEPLILLATLREAWALIDVDTQNDILAEGGEIAEIAHIFDKRILIVTSNPDGESGKALRLDKELKAIRHAFDLSKNKDNVRMDPLTAATIDDFRRSLLNTQYDIVHFSGHADESGLSFFDETGNDVSLDYETLAKMMDNQKNIQCLVLNACHSIQSIDSAFVPMVIGMMDEIEDDAAIAFATGFYDAIAARKTNEEAFREGLTCMEGRGYQSHYVAKLTTRAK